MKSTRRKIDVPGLTVCLILLQLLATSSASFAAGPDDETGAAVQKVVDDLRARLAIPQAVAIAIVATNPKIVSVAAPLTPDAAFELSIESDFLATLSAEELAAALAHELGHVWVSTHHPFLQTERLANDVAMRIVSREHLERVYVKMWARSGTAADITTFLGPHAVSLPDPAAP
jgi:predicted Zn-dependent protease